MEEYHKLDIGSRVLHFRKWKGKDKREILRVLRPFKEQKTIIDEQELMNVLVYNVLKEKDVCLLQKEFKYVLTQIRAKSLGQNLEVSLQCSECKKEIKDTYDLDTLYGFEYSYAPFIESKGVRVHLHKYPPFALKDEYYKNWEKDEEIYADFCVLTKYIEIDDVPQDRVVQDILDDLDVDILDDLIDQFVNTGFRVKNLREIKCGNCGYSETYMFDEIPQLLPQLWFNS